MRSFILERLAEAIEAAVGIISDIGDVIFGFIGDFFVHGFDWAKRVSRVVAKMVVRHRAILPGTAYGIASYEFGMWFMVKALGPPVLSRAEYVLSTMMGGLILAIGIGVGFVVWMMIKALARWAKAEFTRIRDDWNQPDGYGAGGLAPLVDRLEPWPEPPPQPQRRSHTLGPPGVPCPHCQGSGRAPKQSADNHSGDFLDLTNTRPTEEI